MRLPNNEIGISDILAYRDCPQRFVWQMRRHIALPLRLQVMPDERDDPPENIDWRNAYGLAVHYAIAIVERGVSHEEAIEATMEQYGTHLEPSDLALLRDDLNVFERRRPLGVTLIGSELELRVPLFVHEGEQIYFRCRLDVQQRLINNPGVFLHRDYKSSRWPKSEADIHKDPQLWAYNWAVHEYFPECQQLIQTYDQLRYGEHNTSKNDNQRADMKAWLIEMVKLILADETYRPKLNDWCAYCPIVVLCREPRRATAYTRGMLAVKAPLTKEGRKIKVAFERNGDTVRELIETELPAMIETRKHIEKVEEELKAAIKQMPEAEREELGWALREKRMRTISPEGLRALHERLGDAFYQLASVSITRLEEMFASDNGSSPELEIVREWTTEQVGSTNVVPAKSGK